MPDHEPTRARDTQPFWRHPDLLAHMERMALTEVTGSPAQWHDFVRSLNTALTRGASAPTPVGEAGPLTGSNGGFTMVAFSAEDVPVGTKLYAVPPTPNTASAIDALRPFAAAVFNDNGDVTISTGHLTKGDYLTAAKVLRASYDGPLTSKAVAEKPTQQTTVKMKELVWQETSFGLQAVTGFCTYQIHCTGRGVHHLNSTDSVVSGQFEKLSKATEAAQSDNDRRVEECLEP